MLKKTQVLGAVVVLALVMFTGCSQENEKKNESPNTNVETGVEKEVLVEVGQYIKTIAPDMGDLVYEKSLDLKYAEAFDVDYFRDDYLLLTTVDKYKYLVVPEGKSVPQGLSEDTVVIQRPLEGVYVGNSPTMSLVNAMDGLDKVTFTATVADKWYIEDISNAVTEGDLTFAGKYKEPDYEMLMAGGCNLVIQSTMIDGVPEVTDKFKELDMPLLVDRSGEEGHPLGKVEWLKFYAALFDIDMAGVNQMFDKESEVVEGLTADASTGKSVAIFFISSKGKVYARNTDDYVTKMVRLAGGEYIFTDLANTGSNSTSMEMEAFYETAQEADYILYIYSIGGKPETLDDLLERNALLADFKAVKDGNVWATCPEFFQITDVLGQMVGDIHTMLTSESAMDELDYLFKLK